MAFKLTGINTLSEKSKKLPKPDEYIEYIGIDFGSYQTTISTISGYKKTTPTMVGWPKDFIALKFIGKEMVVGDEAYDKRLSLSIYQPLKGGIIKKEPKAKEAADAFLSNIIEQAKGEGNSKKVYAVIGTTPKARNEDKKEIIDLVNKTVDMAMVVSQPFLIAYGQNILNNALIVDIGAETTDLCMVNGTLPSEKDQITINSGTANLDNLLVLLLKRKHESAFINENISRRIKETYGFVGETSKKIKVELPVSAKLKEIDVTIELQEVCESIIHEITQAIMYLLVTLDTDYQLKTRENIFITGGGSLIKGLAKYLENRLKNELGSAKVTAIEDPITTSADGALKLAREVPHEYWNETMTNIEGPLIAKNVSFA